MKFVIDGYEVEIKAKSEYKERFNKDDAKAILNTMAIAFSEASKRYESIGCYALAKSARTNYWNIHNELEKVGYFDDIEI